MYMYFNHMYIVTISLDHLPPTPVQAVDALAKKIERLRIEEVLKITFQIVLVVVLLPTNVTVQGSKKMVVRLGEVRAVWRVGQHLPAFEYWCRRPTLRRQSPQNPARLRRERDNKEMAMSARRRRSRSWSLWGTQHPSFAFLLSSTRWRMIVVRLTPSKSASSRVVCRLSPILLSELQNGVVELKRAP